MHQEIPQWVYIVFTAVTAAGVLMQALVLLGMLFALKSALRRVDEVTKKAEGGGAECAGSEPDAACRVETHGGRSRRSAEEGHGADRATG